MSRDSFRSQIGAFAMVPVWVLERCSSPAVHVYAFLMKHANRERRAWPKTELLAATMGKSLRTVERAIAELRSIGAIETKRRHGRNGAVMGLDFILIQLDPALPAKSGGKDARTDTSDHPATDGGKEPMNLSATDGGMDAGLPATGVAAIPPPVAVYKNELDPGNQIQVPEESVAAAPPPLALPTTFPTQDLVDAFRIAWNELTTPPIPPCDTLTRKRGRLIRACLVERPLDAWREIFTRIEASSFCRGEKGWTASLDWLIKSSDNAAKVLEGHYDDHISDAELTAAAQHLSRATCQTCNHTPRCADWRQCPTVLAMVRRLRARRTA